MEQITRDELSRLSSIESAARQIFSSTPVERVKAFARLRAALGLPAIVKENPPPRAEATTDTAQTEA